jgi:hypothetical protein
MNASVRNKQSCVEFKSKGAFGSGLVSSSNLETKKFSKNGGQQIKNTQVYQVSQVSHRFLQKKDGFGKK